MERPSETVEATACEECSVLIGERRNNIWLLRPLARTTGKPESVEFDGPAALAREEQQGDVLGFWHSHPHCDATPSQRDIDTMQAWVSALGKPLLCVIEGTDGLRGYRFDSDASTGNAIARLERFADGRLVAVDCI